MMKFMHHLAIAALLAALVPTGSAVAGTDRGAERMQQELGLDDAQAQKVRAIMAEQAEKRRALEEETRQRLSTVLNAEQMQRMDEHARQKEARWGERRHERMMEELKLTPEQRVKVEKILTETRNEHEAMDKPGMDREQWRAQKDALHARTREKLAGVLEQDQLARFDEMHARHMRHRDDAGTRAGRHGHGHPDAAPKAETKSAPEPKSD